MNPWADIVFSGLIVGSLYVLVGHGFNLVYLTTRTFNLAQGQFVAMGGLLGYAVVSNNFSMLLLVGVVAFAAIVGFAQEHFTITPILKRGDSEVWLVSTLGVGIFIQGALAALFGQDPLHMALPFADEIISFAGTRQTVGGYVVIAAAVLVTVCLLGVTHLTWMGRALRAIAEDPVAAKAIGINTSFLISGAFMVAAAIGSLAGIIAAPITYARADLGGVLLVEIFVVLAIGGFGSTMGLLIMGPALGIFQSVVKYVFKGEYVSILVFVILLIALLLRPRGLFSGPSSRTV